MINGIFISCITEAWSPHSRKNRRTCLRPCSKEDFKAWFPFKANSTTTTQKTERLCGWAVILPTNRFVSAQNWSLSWSKLALWKPALKLLTYRSQTFLVKYEHMRSLKRCEDQGIPGKLKKTCSQPCACDSYDLCGDQAWLNTNQVVKSKNIDKGDCSISVNLFIWYISHQICYSGRCALKWM